MRRKEAIKRIAAGFLAAVLAVTLLPSPIGKVKAAETEDAVVIDVTDPEYGADSSGKEDCAEAIKKAVAAAKQETGPVIIDFPKGTYQIYPDHAEKRELYISNTTSFSKQLGSQTEQEACKEKSIGILLEGMENVTVEGNGSVFMFHGKMTTFAAIDCKNVTFQDYTVDFARPTVVDITVKKISGNTASIYVPECYEYEISGKTIQWLGEKKLTDPSQRYWQTTNGMDYTQIYDTNEHLTWRGSNELFSSALTSIRDAGDRILEFTYSTIPASIKEGYCYQMRPTVRDHSGTLFWKSEGITLKDLDVRFLHGFGMVGQFSTDITMTGLHFEAPKETGRTTAGYADFIQMSGCKGKIEISDCSFSNPHDDPINIHGTFLKVVQKISDTEIRVQYQHHETSGFPNFFVGDEIEFMTSGDMTPVADSTRKVVGVVGPDGKGGVMSEMENGVTMSVTDTKSLRDIVLKLDRAIPAGVGVNTHVVENITYTPEVSIHDNEFKETPTRGILVTTRKPVVIENNTFDGMGMAGIYISNDAKDWYESGPTKDVTIRNNTFKRGKAQAILVEPTNGTVSQTQMVHENMTIEGNTFYQDNKKVLDAKSVGSLTFKNNNVYRDERSASVTADARTELKTGRTEQIDVNVVNNTMTQALYSFNGCKDVTVEGNHYDGGLNVGGTLQNMTAADVTIRDDEASVTSSNKMTDAQVKLSFESTNEKVLRVSEDGVVTARRAGEASVKTYAVIGGRTIEGNTLDFTVSDPVAEPENVKLADLGFDSYVKLDKRFDAAVTTYNGTATQTQVMVNAAAEEEDAEVTVAVNGKELGTSTKSFSGVLLLDQEENVVKVTVTSPDGKHTGEYTATIRPVQETYLSDLGWMSNSTKGWGEIQKDAEVEGTPLTLKEEDGSNRVFEKGIGTHANSDLFFDLTGFGNVRFESYVGVDASQSGKGGTVQFEVLVDGQSVYGPTETLTSSGAMKKISVEIPASAKTLLLRASIVDNDANDHADWADAKLISASTAAPTVDSIAVTGEPEMIIREDQTLQLQITPAAEAGQVVWSSSNEEIVKIEPGKDGKAQLKAMWPGKAIIMATAGGKQAVYPVTVKGAEYVFPDVKTSDWYYQNVTWAYVNEVIGGYSHNGHFGGGDKLTRGQFALILYRLIKPASVQYEKIFSDVTEDNELGKAVTWASKEGIVNGYTGTDRFGPNDPITRSQIVTMMCRYLKLEDEPVDMSVLDGFEDVDAIQPFAQNTVPWAVAEGLIKGNAREGKNYLDPQNNANRAEAATLIMRFSKEFIE